MLFDKDFVHIDGGYKRMTDFAKENGDEVDHEKLEADLHITQPGYIYIYLSNDEETPVEVYMDDFMVTHNGSYVSQATDYGVWGDVLREQKAALDQNYKYRFGYQGQFAEKDEETGWSFFEHRSFDPVIGRWMSTDPAGQYWSPYVGMGNNPVSGVDPDGAYSKFGAWWRAAATPGDQDIYESDGEWGFTTAKARSDGSIAITPHFGDERSWLKFDNTIIDRATDQYNGMLMSQMSIPDRIMMTRGGDAIEFDAATQLTLGFIAISAGNAVLSSTARLSGAYLLAREGVAITMEEVAPRTISSMSSHSVNQAITRGFNSSDILKVVQEGTVTLGKSRFGNPQWRYMLNGNTVVIDAAKNRVITIFSNVPGTANKLGAGYINPFK